MTRFLASSCDPFLLCKQHTKRLVRAWLHLNKLALNAGQHFQIQEFSTRSGACGFLNYHFEEFFSVHNCSCARPSYNILQFERNG